MIFRCLFLDYQPTLLIVLHSCAAHNSDVYPSKNKMSDFGKNMETIVDVVFWNDKVRSQIVDFQLPGQNVYIVCTGKERLMLIIPHHC